MEADQTDISVLGRYVRAIAVQPDGKILIGGFFGKIWGDAQQHCSIEP